MSSRKLLKKQRATLKDVADAAGVSTAAASLVLNDKPNRFTEETRESIRHAAQELGYVPNQSARSLATQSSSLFALIIPDIENLFFASLAKHIEDECRKLGYSLLIVDTGENAKEQNAAIKRMIQLGVDGLFMVPAYGSPRDVTHLEAALESAQFPVIFIDRYFTGVHMSLREVRWDSFAYDHVRGGMLVADLLADLGHTNIGIIGPHVFEDYADSARFDGFIRQLSSRGIVVNSAVVKTGPYSVSTGYEYADDLIDKNVTAVFCGNDLIALGFMRRLGERGLSVPEDMSVVGYDDVMNSFGLDFKLTTVRQDVNTLAQAGMSKMMKLREGSLTQKKSRQAKTQEDANVAEVTLLMPQIVRRGTVARLKD
ncbi:LacI family DNA-binding transcriptional regulator [Alloscardovia venturai]|uniref:LacI family DNA-binding transcriptional regulator n=1 Tax=Alloscardovia venturai TaxID=1769421 RepID=A0ABW2Y7G2_9BIFI